MSTLGMRFWLHSMEGTTWGINSHILIYKHTLANNHISGRQHDLQTLYNRIVFPLLQPSVDWVWQRERLQNNLTGLWGEPEKRQSPPIWSLRTLQQSTVLLPPLPLLTLLIMALGVMIAFGSPLPAEATITPPCFPNDRLSRKWKRRWGLERER